MFNKFPIAVRVVIWIVLVLITSRISSFGFLMMTQPNDGAVAAGLGIQLVLIACWIFLIMRTNWFKNLIASMREKKAKNGSNHISSFLLIGCLLVLTAGCTMVEPGHVGIVIHRAGSNRGVENTPVRTGWVWFNPVTQQVFEYPIFVQTAVWTKSPDEGNPVNEEITFTTKDSMAVSADISLGFSIHDTKVPAFYVKFRSDDLDTFTHGFLRNLARDHFNETAGKFSVEQVMGDNEPFIKEVRRRLQADLDPVGVKLEQFGFIGAPRPPQQVIESINAKVGAAQLALQKQNEIQQAEAEAKKAIAKAQGEAEANRILEASVTPKLMQWRQLQITEQAVARWNGQRPMVEGQDSGLLLNIPLPAQTSHEKK